MQSHKRRWVDDVSVCVRVCVCVCVCACVTWPKYKSTVRDQCQQVESTYVGSTEGENGILPGIVNLVVSLESFFFRDGEIQGIVSLLELMIR